MIKDIFEEFSLIVKSQSVDAMIPPLIFMILNTQVRLEFSIGISTFTAFAFLFYRAYKKQTILYTFVGTILLVIASLLSLVSQNASNFYIPNILTHGLILLFSIGSLFIQKPLSIYVSHLSRGWPLKWYFRQDIYPAYYIVTVMWVFLFLLSVTFQVISYLYLDFSVMAYVSNLFSLPFTIFTLVITYVVGIYVLKKLKGPSIQEYNQGKEGPYIGQVKGF